MADAGARRGRDGALGVGHVSVGKTPDTEYAYIYLTRCCEISI